MQIVRTVLVGLVAASFTALSALPAAASCAMPEGTLQQRLDRADIAFVGTVTSTKSDGRLARVAVEEVWRGQVGPDATVMGGEVRPFSASSVDRQYETGARYLFVPADGDGATFADNACSDTVAWEADLEELRPETVTMISDDQRREGSGADTGQNVGLPAIAWTLGSAAVALLGIVIVGVFRRWRHTGSPDGAGPAAGA